MGFEGKPAHGKPLRDACCSSCKAKAQGHVSASVCSHVQVPSANSLPRRHLSHNARVPWSELPAHFDGLTFNFVTQRSPRLQTDRGSRSNSERHYISYEPLPTATMPEVVDPRMISVTPRIRYNTIGGVNGPLVILDNVRGSAAWSRMTRSLYVWWTGQIPTIQRDCVLDSA